MSSRDRRRKAVDRSSEWSDWTWDAGGYWRCYRLGPSGEYEYDYKYESNGEYAIQEDSSTKRVLELSSPPLTPPRDWSSPTGSDSSYTVSNSREYSYSRQITSAKTWPAQTPSKSSWVPGTASEDSLKQPARASTWSSVPVSKMTYSSTPTMLTVGSRQPQGFISRAVNSSSRRRFVPKAIKILSDNKEHFARPDTGSDRNIMSIAHATQHKILVEKHNKDEHFRLGTGTYARSIGKAHIPISIPSIGFKKWVSFHVMEQCPNPLIMGSKFIEEIHLYTKNKQLLVEYPAFLRRIPILNHVGMRRQYIPFTADGYSLMASPDTGSELNFMSEECVIRCGFEINASDDVLRSVMLGDESIVDTIGVVEIKSMRLKGHGSFAQTFHVLRGLPCDVIFGDEFLDDIDAFNTCEIVLGEEDTSGLQFNIYGDMGQRSFQSFMSRHMYGQSPPQNPHIQHSEDLRSEMFRRSKADREIPSYGTELWRLEHLRRAAFVRDHNEDACHYCLHNPPNQRPSAMR